MLNEKFTKNKKPARQKSNRRPEPTATRGALRKRKAELKVSTIDVGAGAAGFDPLDLPGCYFWFRADQISGPSDGDNITSGHTVSNEGGSGGFVHSSTSSEQPTYTASAINSKPAITFDGTSELLKLSTEYDVGGACNMFDEDFGSDFTVMIVCRPHDVSDNSQRIFGLYSLTDFALTSSANERNHLWMGIKSASKFSICGKHTGTDIVTAASAISDNEAHIFTAVYDQSETEMFLFQDGHLSASDSSFEMGNGSGVSGNTKLSMGAFGVVSRGSISYEDKFDGDIAEILIYDRKMSERNLTNLHHYLGKKYGINTKSGAKSISRY
tara:strand:+ start:75 stop:1052 length:978 start_codon:yes stop_codon:yes gene_type:complete